MSRASIFDLLHQRQVVSEPVEAPVETRCDYLPDRLRLIDGLALTAAGFIRSGEIPEPATPELSSSLYGADGYRLLVHRVGDAMSVNEPRLGRLDAKALRLHQLIQTVVIEALMMLEALPEESHFDVLLSAPLRAGEAAELVQSRLRDAIAETQYGACLGEVRLAPEGADPHATLDVGEQGGMPYVLWIGVDSLINDSDVGSLRYRDLLARASRGGGLYPGEAVAVLLLQRLTPAQEPTAFDSGWYLEAGIRREHAPRATRRDHDKRQALIALLDELWPAAEPSSEAEEQTGGDETASAAPSRLVIDALGLPGRAVELGGAVVERWPDLDTVDDGLGVDALSGWSGEATRVLPFVLAAAACTPEQHALVLTLHAEQSTQAWALKGCAALAAAAQPAEVQS
ncbi:hypothetical protein EVC62_18840 [Salinicola endophyticus]|uniref:Uncharacterized protein n=1 Tax=Salinicola endophyticus TaxID=1949083 RepID=A0ABY8FKP6_9GAMM|nr:hypothetical protein [Salinicola endophyticus]WFF43383.1 hypothetical protein EVC62_18840 [Salinicola endophyticus]